MKKIKKLSVVVVALTMCLLLGMVAWAVTALSSSTPSNSGQDVSDVTYSATLDKPTVCYDEVKDQTVTLTVKTNKAVDMDGLTAQVTVPDGLTLKSVSNEKLTGETYIYDSETNMLMWYSPDAVNVSNDLLATITLTVPKDTAKDDYEIGFKIIDISKVEGEGEDDAKAGVVWAEDVSLSATLTVADHDYGTEWKSDETNHWHECACGAKSDVAEHDFASGDCVCGAKKPVTGLKGDVNLDGLVNSADLTILARHVGGIELITNTTALANADVKEDGEINSADLTKHARYVGGIITDWSQE